MAPLNTLQAAQLVRGLSGLSLGFSGGTNVLAQNLQRQAAATIQQELVRKARKEQEKKKKGALGGKIGSILGTAAALALIPVTGGLSLAAAGALGGGLAGVGGLAGKAAAGGKLSGKDLLQAGLSTGLGAAGGAIIGAAAPAAGTLASTATPSFGGIFSATPGIVTAGAPLGAGAGAAIGAAGGVAGASRLPTLAVGAGRALGELGTTFGTRPEAQENIPFGAQLGGPQQGVTPGGGFGGTLESRANPALTRRQRVLQGLGEAIDLQPGPGGAFTSSLGGQGIGPTGPLGQLFGDDANAPLRLGGPVVGLDPQQRAQVVQELERENVRVEEARVQERQDLTAIQERQKDRALRISVAQTDIKARKDIELLRQEGFDTRALEGREARAEGAAQTQAGLFERQQIEIEATREAAALKTEAQLGKLPKPTVAQKRIIDEIDEVEKDARQLEQFGISREGTFDTAETAQQLRVLRSRQQELRNLLIQSGGEAFLMAPEDEQRAGALSLRLDPATGNIIFNPPDGSAGIPVRQKLTPLIR